MKLFMHFCLLVFPLFVFAMGKENIGFGVIKGTVSTMDGQPAAYVTVLIKNTGKGTITDTKGNFEIKKIKAGSYILIISLLDYTDSEMSVEVKRK